MLEKQPKDVNTVAALNELIENTNKSLLGISNQGWQEYARPAMLEADEKKERSAAVRLAHRQIKNEFIKRLRAAKIEGII